MSKKTVKHKADLGNLPKLTKQQKAELEALAKMPDTAIDYSDIPPLSDEFWQKAMRNPFYKPTKQSTTVRVERITHGHQLFSHTISPGKSR